MTTNDTTPGPTAAAISADGQPYWNGEAWIQWAGADWLTWDGTSWLRAAPTTEARPAIVEAPPEPTIESHSDRTQPYWNGEAWIQRAGADWQMWDGTSWLRTGVADGQPGARQAALFRPHPPVALGLAGAVAVGIGGFLPFVNQYVEGEHLNFFKPGIGHLSALFALLGVALFAEARRRNSRLVIRLAGGLGALGLLGYVLFLIIGAKGVTDSGMFDATATWTPNVGVIVCILGCGVMVTAAARTTGRRRSVPADPRFDR